MDVNMDVNMGVNMGVNMDVNMGVNMGVQNMESWQRGCSSIYLRVGLVLGLGRHVC